MTAEEITDYIFLRDEDLKGDLAFVFGNYTVWQKAVESAVGLYKKCLVPKIIFAGGPRAKGFVEGDRMAEEAIRQGVPQEDILIENKSLNTLENVVFGVQVVQKNMDMKNIRTLTAIVKNHHARRALMTLRKNWPSPVVLKAAVYEAEPWVTPLNWFETKKGRALVLGEVEKIKRYGEMGSLCEL